MRPEVLARSLAGAPLESCLSEGRLHPRVGDQHRRSRIGRHGQRRQRLVRAGGDSTAGLVWQAGRATSTPDGEHDRETKKAHSYSSGQRGGPVRAAATLRLDRRRRAGPDLW